MGWCFFSIIGQHQRSPNCSNGETGEVTGAYVTGRKCETGDVKAKNLMHFIIWKTMVQVFHHFVQFRVSVFSFSHIQPNVYLHASYREKMDQLASDTHMKGR